MAQTVLLIDDEQSVRVVTSRMLARLGYEVISAADGLEALDLFRQNPDRIDLAIIDLVMPQLDGVQTFLQLKAIREDILAVLASGNDEEEMVNTYGEVGFSGFLQKPFRPAELRQIMDEVLQTGIPD